MVKGTEGEEFEEKIIYYGRAYLCCLAYQRDKRGAVMEPYRARFKLFHD